MIGKKIQEARKAKGFSQEELSEISGINVRTLQRIENSENIPRGNTLNLLCSALSLDLEDIVKEKGVKKKYTKIFFESIALLFVNVLVMLVFGYFTIEQNANANSRIAALLLGFLLPYFIVSKTSFLSGEIRLIKFGSGLILYGILVIARAQFPTELLLGFYPSIFIALGTLFYGNSLVKS